MKILVDTDVLIDYSKGHSRHLETLLQKQKEGSIELFINPVIIAEFLTDHSLQTKGREEKAMEFLNLFSVVDLSKKIGVTAGRLLRTKKSVFLGDALIGATCLIHDYTLATGNTKHFTGIPNLHLRAI